MLAKCIGITIIQLNEINMDATSELPNPSFAQLLDY